MSIRLSAFQSTAALLLFAGVLACQPAHAQAAVNVYQYAVDNPVGDSALPLAPTLGETVPRAISLVPLDGSEAYAYFYYNGSPVIVDVKTRSVVRVGK